MQIILIDDVPTLGNIGDLVAVRDGYARNYLIPNKLAINASTKNQRRLEHEKRVAGFRSARARADAETLKTKLGATSITIARKVGEQDKLYGSVTAQDIAQALADEHVPIDRRKIVLDEPIKSLGVFQVPVRLQSDVTAEVKVWVVAE
ncbi:MAG: 50S ribosomal protein L9 [Myxococcota bacterium]